MTVEQPDEIDEISRSSDSGTYTLAMIETRPLDGSEEQLEQISTKANTYLKFISTGQLFATVPEAQGHEVRVRLVAMEEPSGEEMFSLLEMVTDLFARNDIDFAVQVIPRELIG